MWSQWRGSRALAEPGALERRLFRLIDRGGPIPLSLFMAYANAHYYATRDPLGVGGDFVTAPEISQMFGEMIGLWCADVVMRSGRGDDVALVELGPGRGTLMADVLRAMARFNLMPPVHLVETSPVLRDLQAAAVPFAHFHDDCTSLPGDVPLIVIANEFFDALPVRQIECTAQGWRERMVGVDGDRFVMTAGSTPMDAAVPAQWRAMPPGTVIETSPASMAVAQDLTRLIARQGGVALIIDYGHCRSAPGDTVQAVAQHRYATLLDQPGERDLTAHVDFAAFAAVAGQAGLRVSGPVGQGAFLRNLGIEERAAALMARHRDAADALTAQRDRLCGDDQMGQLFKVMAAGHPDWPVPEGFGQ